MFPQYNNVIMEDFTESGNKEFLPEQDFRESSYEKYVLKKGLEGKPCVDKSLPVNDDLRGMSFKLRGLIESFKNIAEELSWTRDMPDISIRRDVVAMGIDTRVWVCRFDWEERHRIWSRPARNLKTALCDGAADLALLAGPDAKRRIESDMRGCKFTPTEILFRRFLPLRKSELTL